MAECSLATLRGQYRARWTHSHSSLFSRNMPIRMSKRLVCLCNLCNPGHCFLGSLFFSFLFADPDHLVLICISFTFAFFLLCRNHTHKIHLPFHFNYLKWRQDTHCELFISHCLTCILNLLEVYGTLFCFLSILRFSPFNIIFDSIL
jgi:hypothetical protein